MHDPLPELKTGRIRPVILSGGAGTRLWPLSRASLPKQLLALAGPDTMLRATAARVADRARFHPPLVVTGAGHAAIIREQLGDDARLLIEPAARNTAPAIALATLAVLADDPDALLLVMPSDHQVAWPELLMDAVVAAAAVAAQGWLVTFGIRAATPETGYGYIRAGDGIAPGVREALQFVEKPDRARAAEFVRDGAYSWNAGIFLFRGTAMRDALAAHAPDVLAAAEAALAAGPPWQPDGVAFAAAPNISIDHAVFEHADRIAVCPVDPGWSDIGSWDALHGLGVADEAGNVVVGRTELIDTVGCLVQAQGMLVTTVGVNNLNIVATPDAVLVTARGRSQDVKTVVGRLAGDPALARPVVLQHPWGEERLVHDGAGVAARLVTLRPGTSLDPGAARLLPLAGDLGGLPLGEIAASGAVTAGPDGATLLLIG